jgi:transcriptional regulator with XRE-family HTH domain
MIHDDLTQLRQLLARAVQASGRPQRELEREIGVGSGSLQRLLSGDLDLKVEHLTNLARLLRIPPGDLLAAGCPGATAAARHGLADWIGPGDSSAPAATPPAPPSPEELAAMIRAVVREELAARADR